MGLRLNLGCGSDVRPGYLNVDFVSGYGANMLVDLAKFPWPWADGAADEILMLDFLEHFPYRETEKILGECWRVLRVGGELEVQVPDFEHCSYAVLNDPELAFQCNRCGWWFESGRSSTTDACMRCGQSIGQIQDEAIHRLYGGQDRLGNWHYTAFTEDVLTRHLETNGFTNVRFIEENDNGETFEQNWNIKLLAEKSMNVWGE